MIIKPDKIIRAKRKTVSITVDSSGRLIVRAPLRCSEARILAFIEKKSEWILKNRAKKAHLQSLLPSENLNGFQFLLEGKPAEICYFSGKRLVFDEENRRLYLPEGKGEESVQKWLKNRAKLMFSELAKLRANEMRVSYKEVRISSAKSRWGSCSQDNTLRFTFRLLYAPKAIVEYVIVHELAHTKHKNHSQRFWQEVAKYLPDYKARRNWLKAHAYLMHIF